MSIHWAIWVLVAVTLDGETWTRFRGPNGSGVAEGVSSYPVEFGAGRNVVWSRAMSAGKSSPVLTNSVLFLTAEERDRLITICVDRETGKTLWERWVERARKEFRHSLNSGAASTPVTDGENVYSFFADFGLISYDGKGKERWRQPLGPFTSLWGMAASPMLAAGAVVLQMDGLGESAIAAFDQRTGKQRWRVARPPFVLNYTTPFVRRAGGVEEIVAMGSGKLVGYDAETGAERWSREGPGGSTVASAGMTNSSVYLVNFLTEAPPSFESQLKGRDKNGDGKLSPDEFGGGETARLYQGIGDSSGNKDGVLEAAEWSSAWSSWGGRPSVTAFSLPGGSSGAKAEQLWSYQRNLPRAPSPVVWDGILYFVANGGILTALDGQSGAVVKAGRLEGALDNYYSSPVMAGGNLYVCSENGKMVVVKPGAEWKVAAVNDLGEECYATPAFSAGRIFVRTAARLFSFGR
ncbi:MAG: PQQ-binding-like beta-propeller repeat protein [Bryobacteraceae bacterium]